MSADAGWVLGSIGAAYHALIFCMSSCTRDQSGGNRRVQKDCASFVPLTRLPGSASLKAPSNCLPAHSAAVLCMVHILTLLLSRQLMSSQFFTQYKAGCMSAEACGQACMPINCRPAVPQAWHQHTSGVFLSTVGICHHINHLEYLSVWRQPYSICRAMQICSETLTG